MARSNIRPATTWRRSRPRRRSDTRSFSEQLPDLLFVGLNVAIPVAAVDVANSSVAVDQHGRWHRAQVIQPADLFLGIQQNRKVQSELGRHAGRVAGIVIDV